MDLGNRHLYMTVMYGMTEDLYKMQRSGALVAPGLFVCSGEKTSNFLRLE